MKDKNHNINNNVHNNKLITFDEIIRKMNCEYVALAIDFKMNIDPYLYEYDHRAGHMFRIIYTNQCNLLHRWLKFKYVKRYIAIMNDDDMLSIVGHYDDINDISYDNVIIVDLNTFPLRYL